MTTASRRVAGVEPGRLERAGERTLAGVGRPAGVCGLVDVIGRTGDAAAGTAPPSSHDHRDRR